MNLLGVLGNPVEHSRSPEIHALFAASCGIEVDYRKIQVPPKAFVEVAEAFIESGALGFNITVPNKNDAFNFADEVSSEAEQAQAVNTIKVESDGRIIGYNTDGPGIVADIANQGWSISKKRMLIIGAGGAVQGVVGSLLAEDPKKIDIVNRTSEKATAIANRMADPRLEARTYEDLEEEYDVILSGTSAGLTGSSGTVQLPVRIVGKDTLCYDMIYGNEVTPFLKWCAEADCADTCDGLGMLVEQAALAFRIWFGEMTDTGYVINKLRESL